MLNPIIKQLLLFILISSSILSYGAATDNTLPIKITSGPATVDLNQGIVTYQNNVVVTQGDRKLTCDTLQIYFDKNQQITQMKATGNPAKTWEKLNNKNGSIYGEAKVIEALPPQNLIKYVHQAMITENGNVFKGDLIIYNTVTQVVTSPNSGSGNVTIILPPSKTTK